MNRWQILNGSLLILLLFLIDMNMLLEHDVQRRNVEFLPEMVHPVSAESYSKSTVFANGMTLQQPPDGTIPIDYEPFRFAPGEEDAILAGRELQNPLEPTQTVVERGNDLYRAFCLPCHGADGGGMGPVAARGYPAPPSLLAQNARALPDGRLYHIIVHGQNNMPGYAAQVHEERDRWAIVHYLNDIQGDNRATPGDRVDVPSNRAGQEQPRTDIAVAKSLAGELDR